MAIARRALDLAPRQKERGSEAWALRLLGEIAAHADPPDLGSAEAHHTQALTRADDLGMRPLVAHCRFGLGKLFHRTGDRTKAAEHLTIAAAKPPRRSGSCARSSGGMCGPATWIPCSWPGAFSSWTMPAFRPSTSTVNGSETRSVGSERGERCGGPDDLSDG